MTKRRPNRYREEVTTGLPVTEVTGITKAWKSDAPWTYEDHAILRKGYEEGVRTEDIAAALNRTRDAVRKQAQRHGIARPSPWTPELDDIVRRGYAEGWFISEIAIEAGCTSSAVAGRALRLGLSKRVAA